MRISPNEINNIVHVLAKFLVGQVAELRLYGSRVNDAAKGGDIDLLLVVSAQPDKRYLLDNKFKILAEIKELIGEQKIDLKIATADELQLDAFLQLINPQSLLLHVFNKS